MRGRRLLTLLLLLCGLSTTPFFSLEQSPDDGLSASSVPQCGTRLVWKSVADVDIEPAGPDDVDGSLGPDAPAFLCRDARWSPSPGATVPIIGGVPLERILAGTEGLPYHANAPPRTSDPMS